MTLEIGNIRRNISKQLRKGHLGEVGFNSVLHITDRQDCIPLIVEEPSIRFITRN